MRRDGKTTRLIDAAIQELFNNGEVYVPSGIKAMRLHGKDGGRGIDDYLYFRMTKYTDYDFWEYDGSINVKAQDDFARRFKDRLNREHGYVKICSDGFIYKVCEK